MKLQRTKLTGKIIAQLSLVTETFLLFVFLREGELCCGLLCRKQLDPLQEGSPFTEKNR